MDSSDFLGTYFVVDKLSSLNGWNKGSIVFDESPLVRNPSVGFIIGVIQKEIEKELTAITKASPLRPPCECALLRNTVLLNCCSTTQFPCSLSKICQILLCHH